MGKVNMNYKFETIEGEAIPRETGKTRKVKKDGKEIDEVLTEDTRLKHICISVLMNPEVEMGPDGKPRAVEIDGNKKFDRFHLASKIYNANGIIELDSKEEITPLKDLIGSRYGPLIVGQAWDALEGKRGLEVKKTIPNNKK